MFNRSQEEFLIDTSRVEDEEDQDAERGREEEVMGMISWMEEDEECKCYSKHGD